MTETFAAALRRGAATLAAAGVPGDTARDARALLEWASGLGGAALTAAQSDPLTKDAARRFAAALDQRRARRPVAQITGRRLFWGRAFEVTPDVLDPRPETEILVAAALERPAPLRVLDLGTGAGCLLGTLLAERPGATGLGVDASPAALAVAARNMDRLGLSARAELRVGDWLEGVAGPFDLILCNPPYITASEMLTLAPEVRDHEPTLALSPGGDGLDPYRRIAPGLAAVLAPGGRAIFEIGPRQGAAVSAIFTAAGLAAPEVRQDFDGRDRAVIVAADSHPAQTPTMPSE